MSGSQSVMPAKPEFSHDLVIADLPGVPARQLKGLDNLAISTIRDLLSHYPRRYEDRREFDAWPTGPLDKAVCIHGEVTDVGMKRFGSGRNQGYFEASLEPVIDIAMAGPIYMRWFNMPFMNKVIAVGMELVVYGQPKISGKKMTIAHPDYEAVDPDAIGDESIHMGRITPIYPASSGVTQHFLRAWIHRALGRTQPQQLLDVIPIADLRAVDPDFAMPDRLEALRQVHFPDSWEEMQTAREYLALEEFVAMQIEIVRRKRSQVAVSSVARCGEGHLLEDFVNGLPFELTGAQKRCIEEVRADLQAGSPMNRLLQGDVGSGKTVIAFAAMLLVVEAGFQAAIMAPTQILAEQHFLTFRKLGEKLDLRISLRTGSKAEDSFAGGLFGGEEPQILVGTHALIHDKVKFENLGLAVIDEQHKFGVSQRSKLAAQGDNPDVLVMTATPIPRTLTMTVYGDLDVSILDEAPKGRGKIITGIRETTKTRDAAKFLKEQLDEGRQAYIVYPLIEESGAKKSQAAAKEFEAWKKRLKDFEVALLHGRIPADQKEVIMSDFRDNKTDVLVATTVIEVGVDVPNANVMLIYNAENFGLAQLHQLRGRIGRGEHKSYCILMCDPKQTEAFERLKVLEETRDGFLIAEEDLRIRGPGDVLGTQQSGLPKLRFASMLMDTRLVKKARDVAEAILQADPQLSQPEHAVLAEAVERQQATIGDVSA
ncbi:MAG: ATP-dependent DNA helicase RecG [Verrucomicrobiales bacterium]|jgi:ATP-dependent DNA helicase RecG